MVSNPYQKYQQSTVQTASPAQLTLMLYDGAIRFIRQSIESIESNNIEKANSSLIKAQKITNELTASLNFQYPLSTDLARIYEYIVHLLITANVNKRKEPAIEALSYMMDLKEAWAQAAKQVVSISSHHG
ncbi:flagellar export chaperone FliS [Cohnella luojiensis]|uniref:Flagellar secretion chaperone FliS n=1 Tax=Cohnella luojiensis TaxID=652876 RepID=A0A4Y8M6L4_9BACL|nr:flagellar export chaperone FliS [Cohnella luojiensis]TFE29034.1 flagellar export chaperone FliS [Cohnella luojiensis]